MEVPLARNPELIRHIVVICNGSDCSKKGAKNIGKAVRKCAKEMDCREETLVIRSKCAGLCGSAPVVTVQPKNQWITKATPKKVVDAFRKLSA